MTKFIFITGGVVSSLGKGICAASLASILQGYGYKVRVRKLDPYLNVDPGTMSPMQHGEVYVTDDGAETDLDLGHYERFTDITSRKDDNITAGQIYSTLLAKERKGDYLGGTVQVIPHVTDLIKEFIMKVPDQEDFIICEIGGTVGDIEGLPFIEAIRQIGYEIGSANSLFIHVTLIPYIKAAKELKTKPSQHSIKELRSIGIVPGILVCRSEQSLSESEKDKISLFCNIAKENVIEALDLDSIYRVPVELEKCGLGRAVIRHFAIADNNKPNLSQWQDYAKHMDNAKTEIEIAIVGKYIGLEESYKSLIEALSHAGFAHAARIKINWIDAKKIKTEAELNNKIKSTNAILVPGAFGINGNEIKQLAIKYARVNKIPFLGICFGMQMAVIEFAKNVLGLNNPYSTEICEEQNGEMVVGLMHKWQSGNKLELRNKDNNLGGTMRLGSYPCVISKDSKAYEIYNSENISERHRHRYEVNIAYKDLYKEKGMDFVGISPDGNLPEIVEIKDHPFFIAVQFHPEFKSRPFKPHPLFSAYIKAAKNK